MSPPSTSVAAFLIRDARHRQKMQRKAEDRAALYARHGALFANQLVRRDRRGKITGALSVRPNNGQSDSIWPKGKVAKPGRMG